MHPTGQPGLLTDIVDDALNGPGLQWLIRGLGADKQPFSALPLLDVLLEHQPGPDAEIHHPVFVSFTRDQHGPIRKIQVIHIELRRNTLPAHFVTTKSSGDSYALTF